jgi:hypothetical protein
MEVTALDIIPMSALTNATHSSAASHAMNVLAYCLMWIPDAVCDGFA